MGGVEWRIKHCAKIFSELDAHGQSRAYLSPTELGLARVRHFEVAQVGYIRLGVGEVGEQSEPGGGHMKIFRGLLLVVTSLVLQLTGAAQAQSNYPNRPVALIVTVPPGGAADFVARIIGSRLTDVLGQPVVTNNRGGAGGTIAAAAVAKAEPDGHTLLLNTIATHGIGPHLYPNLPYDPVKDFSPIILVAKLPLIMTVNADLPVQS